jgi:multiple sugar transport system ATP-binding protein
MNLLTGRLVEEQGRLSFRTTDGVRLPIPDRASGQQADVPALLLGQSPLVYGVRPEHVVVASEGVPADVVIVEPTGSATHVVLQVGAQRITSVRRDRVNLTPGDRVHVDVDPAMVHLFDAGSGRRVDVS